MAKLSVLFIVILALLSVISCQNWEEHQNENGGKPRPSNVEYRPVKYYANNNEFDNIHGNPYVYPIIYYEMLYTFLSGGDVYKYSPVDISSANITTATNSANETTLYDGDKIYFINSSSTLYLQVSVAVILVLNLL